ncbi:MAG: M23 family metallopeptidase, partial [Gemmatimonadota bacterium]
LVSLVVAGTVPAATFRLAAQQSAARVTLSPAVIRQGTLIRVTVMPADSGTARTLLVAGRLAGEPLHFLPNPDLSWTALAPVPVGAAAVLTSHLALIGSRSSDTVSLVIPVSDGQFTTDNKLTVAPKFGRPPTSAEAKRIAADNAKAREVGRHAHDTPQLWRLPFALPRSSRITAHFGDGRVFNGQVQSRHLGTDFAGQVGEPIHAANRGVVALVASFQLAGTVVYIDHGQGLTTGYFHMSQALVAIGDTVERGQLIGRVGNSGRVTGPHLHWVFRYGGVNLDPASLEPLGLLMLSPSQPKVVHDSLR